MIGYRHRLANIRIMTSMANLSPPPLAEKDVRAVASLLGRVIAMEGSVSYQKRALLDGLATLTGADCWVWARLAGFKEGEQPTTAGFLHGGFPDSRFATYLRIIEHPDMEPMNASFLSEVLRMARPITRLREQVVTDNRFLESPCLPLWKAADLAPILLSARMVDEGDVSLIALYRKWADPAFTPREARLAHIVISEVDWLHEDNAETGLARDARQMAPRYRMVANLLLRGLPRRDIAAHLEISPATVDGYIKKVYAFYDVHSHAELMKRFREGDGGDVPNPAPTPSSGKAKRGR